MSGTVADSFTCVYACVCEFLASSILVAVLVSLSICEGHYFVYCKQPSVVSDRSLWRVGSIRGMGWDGEMHCSAQEMAFQHI